MDDELPLSALAKPGKAKSYDDDVPLVQLATPGAKKGRPAAQKSASAPAAAAGAGKGSGKAAKKPGVKKAGSSSSSSSSYSSSSSSSSGAKAKKKIAKRKIGLLRQKKKETTGGEEGADNAIRKKDRSPKESLVADLLCRWWYAIPEWPPSDPEYYKVELAKRNLREVSIQKWEWVEEVDKQGYHKVYELSQFKGLYRKSDGSLIDVRPKDTMPSFNNFFKKDMADLLQLLVKAYENQLKDLQNSKYDEKELETKLKNNLTKLRHKAGEADQYASKKRKA